MLFWRKGLHKSLARLAEGPQLGVARQAEDVAGKYGKDLPKMRVFIGKSSGWRWREREIGKSSTNEGLEIGNHLICHFPQPASSHEAFASKVLNAA